MKYHQKIFLALILLLPVQLGLHFWPDYSLVLGIRIDYLSPTIYLTDIVLFFLFLSFLIEEKPYKKIKKALKRDWIFLSFFLFLVISSLFSSFPVVSLLKLLKLLELLLLGVYVVRSKIKERLFKICLMISSLYISLIGIIQFFLKSSVGSLFWFLGERSFNISNPSIARISLFGESFLRPYSILPHPNVLAGFLLASFFIFKSFKAKSKLEKIFSHLVIFLLLTCFLLCFSRSAFLALFLILVYLVLFDKKLKLVPFLLIGLVFFLYSILPIKEFVSSQSFLERLELNKIALRMFLDNPLKGVGLNNFIPLLPFYWNFVGPSYLLQPVHNLFLLVLSETGIICFLAFLYFFFLAFKNQIALKNKNLLFCLLVIVVTGFFDHYWLTLQQPMLLFSIVFGLSFKR